MTLKLFEQSAYITKFSAVVDACEIVDGKFIVELDKTAFFPEGGGQDADAGTINGVQVLDVQLQGDRIVHVLEREIELFIGQQVVGEIDWELRYARMQGHTGEHILSGVVNALYGYDNVGFHMSEKIMTVDFNGALSAEDIKKIEMKANEAVYKNAKVKAYYPTAEELAELEYRSKKELESDIRIVEIGEDIDCCACCAPHVERTGEIGLIKVIDFYSFKQGTRLEMLAGKYAFEEFMDINASTKELMKVLSVPRTKIVDAVREKNQALQDLRFEYQKLSRRLALKELELCEKHGSVYAFTEKLSFDDLRYCANTLMENEYNICFLLSKNEEEGYSYVVSSQTEDVRPIVKELNETFSGKGGGKSNYSQGKIGKGNVEELRKFVEKVLCNE